MTDAPKGGNSDKGQNWREIPAVGLGGQGEKYSEWEVQAKRQQQQPVLFSEHIRFSSCLFFCEAIQAKSKEPKEGDMPKVEYFVEAIKEKTGV